MEPCLVKSEAIERLIGKWTYLRDSWTVIRDNLSPSDNEGYIDLTYRIKACSMILSALKNLISQK